LFTAKFHAYVGNIAFATLMKES